MILGSLLSADALHMLSTAFYVRGYMHPSETDQSAAVCDSVNLRAVFSSLFYVLTDVFVVRLCASSCTQIAAECGVDDWSIVAGLFRYIQSEVKRFAAGQPPQLCSDERVLQFVARRREEFIGRAQLREYVVSKFA